MPKLRIGGEGLARQLRAALIAALVAVFATVMPGAAFAGDAYSIGRENTYATQYTAAAVTRTEHAMSLPGTSCGVYQYPVVYEPLWLINSASSPKDWMEIGTGYSCNNVRYRYTYQCLNGSCAYGTATTLVNGGVDIRFRIVWNGSFYVFQAGSDTLATAQHGYKKFSYIDVGTEVYNQGIQNTAIRRQDFKSLAFSVNFGSTGYSWTGQDYASVTPNSGMCGGWVGSAQRYSGRYGTC